MPTVLCILAATMWAGCGIAAQHLFEISQIGVMELTTLRMLVTAVLMGILTYCNGSGMHCWRALKKRPKTILEFMIYGLFGLLAMHVTYFKAIALDNAAVATVIQYTCPIMILLWTATRRKTFPSLWSVWAVLFAVLGTFLIACKGNWNGIQISMEGFLCALLSALFLAVATIYPKHLLIRFDNSFVLAWGMAWGGLASWGLTGDVDWFKFWDPAIFVDLFVIVICGTAGAFVCFNAGLKYISPTRASLIATIEPAVSVIMSYAFFRITFSLLEMIGIAFILFAIVLSGRDHS